MLFGESGHATDGCAFVRERLRDAGVLVALTTPPGASSQATVAVQGVEGAESSQRGTDGIWASARFSNSRVVSVLGIVGMGDLDDPAKSQRCLRPFIAISDFQ